MYVCACVNMYVCACIYTNDARIESLQIDADEAELVGLIGQESTTAIRDLSQTTSGDEQMKISVNCPTPSSSVEIQLCPLLGFPG